MACVATENFFKHANSDPAATHTFNTDYTDALSFDAVLIYSKLAGECSPELAIYLGWFVALRPSMCNELPPDVGQELQSLGKLFLKDGRKKFYERYNGPKHQ
jgi:hypothetical protein